MEYLMIRQKKINKFKVAENLENLQYTFRTVISEIQSVARNPAIMIFSL